MDIKQFANERLKDAKQLSIDNGTTTETEMAKYIIECMEESGEVCSPDLCEYDQGKTRITAYDCNDEAKSLDLFLFVKAPTPAGKVASRIDTAFNCMQSFYRQAMAKKPFGGEECNMDKNVQDAVETIRESRGMLSLLRLFVLTDGIVAHSPQTSFSIEGENGLVTEFEVWDISRIYRMERLKNGAEGIEIDFANTAINANTDGGKARLLPCLKVDDENPDVVSYLTAIPGNTLARIYNEYRQMLLEKNVRTYLRNKSKVNKQIASTLKEDPTKFFAYNNGISATVKSIEFGTGGSEFAPTIKKMDDLQIVNGGQTTATIAEIAKNGGDLSNVFVAMKINVVRNAERYNEIVKAISTSANSQAGIKKSDFDSGDELLKEFEKISRSEKVPTDGTKWYFERMRGQYTDERNSLEGYNQKLFTQDYPKKQMVSKTDIATVAVLWSGKPYIGCYSREKCFEVYIKALRKENATITVSYFHDIIALCILYKSVEEAARVICQKGDFVSRVVAYALAAIAELSERKLDINYIWEKQRIQPELQSHIERAIGIARAHLERDSTRSYARSTTCWAEMKEGLENTAKIGGILLRDGTATTCEAQGEDTIKKANAISSIVWEMVYQWAIEEDKLDIMQRKHALNYYHIMTEKKGIKRTKQAEKAIELIEIVKKKGFIEWLDRKNKEECK